MSELLTKTAETTRQLFDQALIKKYDGRGPRYTSYPTAVQFAPFSPEDYQACLADAANRHDSISLYVHIPFCHDICYYCACSKIVTRDLSLAETYLHYLEKEMRLIRQTLGKRVEVKQLHFGGGTPTFLNSGQLTQLIFQLSTYFNLSDQADREYSIEVDPRTVNRDSLALLKGLGFNRLSFGVQDFDPAVQKAVNREHSFEDVSELISSAKEFGFNSINIDLIYGLPKQTQASLSSTLDKVLALDIDRIAFYNYAHLPERFASQRAIDRLQVPSAEERIGFLQLIGAKLGAAGFTYIGMDHFVKPSDSLAVAQKQGVLQRNFQGYSVAHSPVLVAMGLSSISNGAHYFAQNYKQMDSYYAALDQNLLPVERGCLVSEDDLKRRAVIMPIICNLYFNIAQWEEAFQEDFWQYFAESKAALESMQDDGLLIIRADSINILPAGRVVLRNICLLFDAYAKDDTFKLSKIL